MCDQHRACDEGTSCPCLLYDDPKHSHEQCLCGKRRTTRSCSHPDCRKRFKPHCRAAIFCCYDCFFKSGLEPYWDFFYAKYADNIDKLKRYLSKTLYRKSAKGKASRNREYGKHNKKRREKRRLEAEQVEHTPPAEMEEEIPPAEAEILPPSRSDPKRCRRPGCLKLIELPSHVEVKHFCSTKCKNAFRNIRNILERAYEASKCPCVLLMRAFLSSL